MDKPKCPFCGKIQVQNPLKSWKYGKIIVKRTEKGTEWGNSVKCSRYQCDCKKLFNFYQSKNSTKVKRKIGQFQKRFLKSLRAFNAASLNFITKLASSVPH